MSGSRGCGVARSLRSTVQVLLIHVATGYPLAAQSGERLPATVAVPAVLSTAASPVKQTDSVTLRFANTELRTVVQALAQYLERPVVYLGQSGFPVSFETPQPVPRSSVERLLRGLLESHNFELTLDTAAGLLRARPRGTGVTAGAPGGFPRTPVVGGGNVELFVLALQHARATEIAQTVNALYGRAAVSPTTGLQASTLADELRVNAMPPMGGSSTPGPSTPSRTNGLTGDLTVVADGRGNNLLIRANRADFEVISTLVQRLDVRPLQVLIEVIIAEVQRSASMSIGVEGALMDTKVGGTASRVSGSLGSAGLGDFAMQVMKLGGLDLDATLTLASQRGDVKILSRPIVLAANNQRAEIVVGSQRPFVQVQRSLPTENAARDQVVQYRDVGTKLTVLPTISPDGMVQLEVAQEVSTATSEMAFNAPVISTRSVRTDLLIRDGQTVALGGLTGRERSVDQGGVPLLSSVPLLGGLLGHASRSSNETELFIFLTPHLIRNDADATRVTAPLQQRAEKVRP